MLRACLILLGASVLGCGTTETFACDSADDCSGSAGGACEPAGYCSFPDDTCMSGRRYGQHAPAGIAGTCTPPSDDTGGSSGASDSAASSSDGTTMPGADGTSSSTSSTSSLADTSTSTQGEGSSSSDAVESTSIAETSTGTEGCEALDCGACIECTVASDGPCEAESASCEATAGCSTAVACIQSCVVRGVCLDPCCDGAPADEVDLLVLCVAEACSSACTDNDFFTCNP